MPTKIKYSKKEKIAKEARVDLFEKIIIQILSEFCGKPVKEASITIWGEGWGAFQVFNRDKNVRVKAEEEVAKRYKEWLKP